MYLDCVTRGPLCPPPATDLLTEPRDARGVTADARPVGVNTAIFSPKRQSNPREMDMECIILVAIAYKWGKFV